MGISKYFANILVSLDQLGNTLCGGDPDFTISARVGYFAETRTSATKYYWKFFESIINFTFWPVDGPGHCRQAFEADPENALNNINSDFFLVFLSVFIMAFCIPISAFLYLIIWPIKQLIKWIF